MKKRITGSYAGIVLISLLIASCIDSLDVQAEIIDPQSYYIERVSVSSGGGEGNGGSVNSSVSGDGRYIAFDSNANNLVAGDNNGQSDVFVYDRQAKTTRRASISSDSAENSNGASGAKISRDGRYVAFSAYSKTLVPRGDWMTEAFVRDLSSEKTINLNTSSTGEPGNGPAFYPSFGHSDTFVVFTSTANNLVSGDNNGRSDVFIRNLENGMIERVSIASDGTEGNGDSSGTSWAGSSVSSDGRYVIFVSSSTNLVAGENSNGGVFVRDRVSGETKRIFKEINSGQSFDVESLSISDEGKIVTFSSLTKKLVAEDINNFYDIFMYNVGTGKLLCLSSADLNSPMIWHSYNPSLSADGRFVVFDSPNMTLVPEDVDSESDIFVYDNMFGQMTIVSKTSGGLNADNMSSSASISADGSIISFSSLAANLVPTDSNGAGDIFVVENPYLSDGTSGSLPVPTELSQKDAFGEVGIGKIINEGQPESVKSIYFSARVSDLEEGPVALEVHPVIINDSGSLSWLKPIRSTYVSSGEIASVEYMPEGGVYTWIAATVNESGKESEWVYFGDNAYNEADFISSNFSFVFMTDVHLGSNLALAAVGHEIWKEKNVWSESRSYPRFTDVLYDIKNIYPKPKFILIGGDNVEYNNTRWLQDFKAITDTFAKNTGIKVYFVPGNHDRYDSESGGWEMDDVFLSGGNDYLKNYFEVIGEPSNAFSFFDNEQIMDATQSGKGGYNRYNYYFNYWGLQFIGLDSGEDTGVMDLTPESEGIQNPVMSKLESLDTANAYGKVIFMHNTVQDDGSSFTEFDNGEISLDNIVPDGAISNNWKKFVGYCEENNVQIILSGHTHEDLVMTGLGNKINLSEWRENETYPLYIQTQSASKNGNHGYRVIDVKNGGTMPQDAEKSITKYEKVFIDLDAKENFESHVFDADYENREIDRDGSGDVFYMPSSDRTILYKNTEKTIFEVKNNNDSDKLYDLKLQKRELNGEPDLSLNFFTAYAILHQSCGKYGIPCIEGYLTALKNDKWTTLDFSNMRSQTGSNHRFVINWGDLQNFTTDRIDLEIDGNDDASYIKMKDLIAIDLNSPGELHVFDREGNVTGLVNGKIVENIPNSIYVPESEMVYIYGNTRAEVADGLRTQVVGLYEATYDLSISLLENDREIAQFVADDILINESMLHQFKINWEALEEGSKGVMMEVDENKDGIYDKFVVSGANLVAPRPIMDMDSYEGIEGSPMVINASSSFDSDGLIVKYEWDFNDDGLYEEYTLEPMVSHTYQDDFNGKINIKVIDNDGLEGLAGSLVMIKNSSPQINITKYEIADSADMFILGADLFDQGILDLHTARVDWGDGSIEDIVIDQELTLSVPEEIIVYHHYNIIRKYMVKLEVRDDDGGMGEDKAYFTSPKELMGDILSEIRSTQVGGKKIGAELDKAEKIFEKMLDDKYWQNDYYLKLDSSQKFYLEVRKGEKILEKNILEKKKENFEIKQKIQIIVERIKDLLDILNKIHNYKI